MITGQIIVRTQGNDTGRARKGTALVMIVGIIEVPNESHLNAEGVQYTIVNNLEYPEDWTLLKCQNLKEQVKGMDASGMLLAPIWRT